MNLSIVLPGKCNANCQFCFNKNRKCADIESSEYRDKLFSMLEYFRDNTPDNFQISITGGEPTLSPHFIHLLNILSIEKYNKKFHKIVLTTNGAKFPDYLPEIAKAIDHINISRHHWDIVKRGEIFKTTVISDHQLIQSIHILRGLPILKFSRLKDITYVAVVTKDIYNDIEFYSNFINYCQENHVECAFRKDYNMSPWFSWPMASIFLENFPNNVGRGSCSVCEQWHHNVFDTNVTWKFSMKNPTDVIKDYEYIFAPDGNLYYDWDYKYPVTDITLWSKIRNKTDKFQTFKQETKPSKVHNIIEKITDYISQNRIYGVINKRDDHCNIGNKNDCNFDDDSCTIPYMRSRSCNINRNKMNNNCNTDHSCNTGHHYY
jgi:organic radical activating enzyme